MLLGVIVMTGVIGNRGMVRVDDLVKGLIKPSHPLHINLNYAYSI